MDFNIELLCKLFQLEFNDTTVNNLRNMYVDHPKFCEIKEPIENLLIIYGKIKEKKRLNLNLIRENQNKIREIYNKDSNNSDFLFQVKPIIKTLSQLKCQYSFEMKSEKISENWKENHKKINDFILSQLYISNCYDLKDKEIEFLYEVFIKFAHEQIKNLDNLNSFVRFMIYFQYSYLFDYNRKMKTPISDCLSKQCEWLSSDNERIQANINIVSAIKYACQNYINIKSELNCNELARKSSLKFCPFFKVTVSPVKNVYNIILLEEFSFQNLQKHQTMYIVNEVNKVFKKLHDEKMKSAKLRLLKNFNFFVTNKSKVEKLSTSTAESCLYNELIKIKEGIFEFDSDHFSYYSCYCLKYTGNNEKFLNKTIASSSFLYDKNTYFNSNLNYLDPFLKVVIIGNIKDLIKKLKIEYEQSIKNTFYKKNNLVPFNLIFDEIIETFKKYYFDKEKKYTEISLQINKSNFRNKFKLINDVKNFIGEGKKLREDKLKYIDIMLKELLSLKDKSPKNVYYVVSKAYDNVYLSSKKHKLLNFESIFNKTTLIDLLNATLVVVKRYSN